MKLSEQVKPISYFKAHASEIFKDIRKNCQPVIITQNGEATVILEDLETKESLAMLKIIAQSRKSLIGENYKSVNDSFLKIRNRIKGI